MNLNRIMVLVGAVIALVVFYTLLPTIITSIVDAQGTTGLTTQADSILDISQLVVAVGGIAIAGVVIFSEIRSRG